MKVINRARFLATGRAEWEDTATGEVTVTHESWRTRWAMAGVHSYKWWWVRRYGKLECGCTRNPVTRRMLLIRHRCPKHMPGHWNR